MTEQRDTHWHATQLENFLNGYSSDMDAFVKDLKFIHPTLQQLMTKLCVKWLEEMASEEHYVDGRNRQSQELARKLLETTDQADRYLSFI